MSDKNKPTDENNNTNLVMDTTNYLSKEEYYKSSLTANINTILIKYHTLIVDCLKYSVANITKLKRKQLDFVIIRCYDTITHVFLNILLYTKNLDIVLLYCQKSCYFYVEFVNQITDEQNNFLQLGSKDACIYVYKKILLDINMEYYKNANKNGENTSNTDKDIYFLVTEYTKLCKSILLHLNSCVVIEPIHNVELFKQFNEIINYFIKLEKSQIHLYMNWICIVNDFFNVPVTTNNFTNISNTYVYLLLLFIKQLDKKGKNIYIEQYIQKIISNETKEKIIELFDNINNNIHVVNIQHLNEFIKWFFL